MASIDTIRMKFRAVEGDFTQHPSTRFAKTDELLSRLSPDRFSRGVVTTPAEALERLPASVDYPPLQHPLLPTYPASCGALLDDGGRTTRHDRLDVQRGEDGIVGAIELGRESLLDV